MRELILRTMVALVVISIGIANIPGCDKVTAHDKDFQRDPKAPGVFHQRQLGDQSVRPKVLGD